MQELVWKLRIATLWIFFGVAMPTAMLLWMVEPGAIKEIMTGTVEGEDLSGPAMIVMALFILIPMAMAFLTLVLKDTVNRWANGVLGLIVAILTIPDISGSLGDSKHSAFALVMVASLVAALLIVWHAWKWPEPKGAASVRHEDHAMT